MTWSYASYSFSLDLLALYEVNSQISAIEELISQGADMQVVLRLLCLASIITGGIKAKTLENIKREVLHTALAREGPGHWHLAPLNERLR